MSPFNFAQMSS